MSVTRGATRVQEFRQFEERSNPRYTINLEVQYKLLKAGKVEHTGHGQTLNMSSAGILFEASDALDAAKISVHRGTVVLEVKWPYLLDNRCPLKLVARGRLVRRDAGRFAVRIEAHEFHTAGTRADSH